MKWQGREVDIIEGKGRRRIGKERNMIRKGNEGKVQRGERKVR